MTIRSKMYRLVSLVAAGTLTLLGGAATAQEVTLKAVNAFQEGTYFARNFERFVKKLNDEGKGVLQINYIGGPKAIPTFEQPTAVRNGVVDMAATTTSFAASVAPEGLALNYTDMNMAELRKSGAIDYLNGALAERGLNYLGRTGEGVKYHIYLNKKIDKADLTGLKLRTAPIYRDFFNKLGASVVQTAPGEVYTALERGVVDGYGWPLLGIFDLGWHEKTKYRLEPGFYALELGVMMNLAALKKLTPPQREYLEKQVAWMESQNADIGTKDAPAEIKKQADAGIQVIKLDDTQAKILVKTANDAGWATVITASPNHGTKLRDMIAPK